MEQVDRRRFDESAAVLCEAFRDYPAMRFFLADAGERYDRHLRLLIGFFTEARLLRGDPVLGVSVESELAAVAYVVPPDSQAPAELERRRETLWSELGDASRERYEAFGRATGAMAWPEEPHYDLALIGVRSAYAGRGLAGSLMDAVHRLSGRDPASRGVALTTENPRNLSLYEHFGYRRLGHARLPGLETWGLFRDDPVVGA